MSDVIPTGDPANPQPAATEPQSPTPAELEPLTPEEELFVDNLLEENMNRTRAYMKTFPKASYESAKASASRMLAKVNVKAEVRRRLDEEAMTVEEAVAHVARIARGTILPFLKKGPDGFIYMNLNDPEAERYMYLIKEMEAKRQRRIIGSGEAAEEWEEEWVRVKIYSAYEANLDILKMHGKFTKKVDLTTDGKPLPAVDQAGYNQSMKAFVDALTGILTQDDSPKPNES